MLPIVDQTKARGPDPTTATTGTINPDTCKKHCHYPAVEEGMPGCPCMDNRRECDFEWDETGRGFCKNCHHGSSLTVKASDCTLTY